jgi:GNAT superfamily N-acetyltransferase
MEPKRIPLSNEMSLVDFIPKEATEEMWEVYFHLSEMIFREFNKKGRLPDRGVVRRLFSTPNPLHAIKRWLVLSNEKRAVAYARMSYDTELSPDYEINRHIFQAQISVAPEYRKQKIASLILKTINRAAKEMGKETLMAEADNPVGVKFCSHLRGVNVHEVVEHRLYVEDINWDLVKEWVEKGKAKSPRTTVELFKECPERDIDEFCRVYTETINQRPTGDMEQGIITTPESRRVEERNFRRRGIDWYTMISRDRDGRISALTDIMYDPEEPHRVNQYFTGVLNRYRRKGLAKRLKAEMLFVIRDKFPEVEYIKTTTARANHPMRAINKALGFQPTKTLIVFQWALTDLEQRLEEILTGPDDSSKKRPSTLTRKSINLET